MSIYHEKADQAIGLLAETELDVWLTFVRETGERPDPGVDMVVGTSLTWPSAFLLARSGERIAIVGRYDVPNIQAGGVFSEVIGYDQDIRAPLLIALERLAPQRIGLNFSLHDSNADGLTYGMLLLLQNLLEGTVYRERLESAAPLLTKLRARKTASELARIEQAIAITEELIDQLTLQIQPGRSEAELAAWVHQQIHAKGLATSWDWDYCPTLNSGPESPLGHVMPQAHINVAPGHLVHIDVGVRSDGYCSDIQRMWYVRREGESAPPPEVQRAWETVIAAIAAGAQVLRPGVKGWEVDAAARAVIVAAGYPEYQHALGHGLGRACHDGGPLLGPRWARYGDAPDMIVEEGHVYTLELGVPTPAGYCSLEEDVVVTADGCRFLSRNQQTLFLC